MLDIIEKFKKSKFSYCEIENDSKKYENYIAFKLKTACAFLHENQLIYATVYCDIAYMINTCEVKRLTDKYSVNFFTYDELDDKFINFSPKFYINYNDLLTKDQIHNLNSIFDHYISNINKIIKFII